MPSPLDTNMRFLVVDDHFNVRRMIAGFLRANEYYNVREAPNGEQAQAILINEGTDFIICDWNMPIMNGVTFLKKVRADKRFSKLPFLMVTAETATEIVAECIEEGVDDYITKPFRADTLIGKIQSIMEKKKKPSPLDVALEMAQDNLEKGNIQKSLAIYQKTLEKVPDSPRVNLGLGTAYEALGENKKALAYYTIASRKAKRFVKAHDKLAALYAKIGDDAKACEHGKIASAISPRNVDRQLELGQRMLKIGDKEGASKALTKAAESSASDPELSNKIGEMLLEAKMYDKAAEAFENAVTAAPEQLRTYNRLGIAYRKQKLYDKAIQQYLRALDVSPDNESIYYNMAVAQVEANQISYAKQSLNKALKINPDFTEARKLYDRIYDYE